MVAVLLGRKPAVADPRVPFLHWLDRRSAPLPDPPPWANWYAGVPEWPMLGNDIAGDCVCAMAGHATQQFSNYRDQELTPTTDEALALYSAITGYDPTNPATDQGTVVMGPSGLMQYWATHGVVFGGANSKAGGFAQVQIEPRLDSVRQAIHYFGGIGLGINLPECVVAGAMIPYMWGDFAGAVAGGHEVWVDGYDVSVGGTRYFDFVSWGQRYRMTAEFLLAVSEEAVAIYDADSINARGLNADGIDVATLTAAMASLAA